MNGSYRHAQGIYTTLAARDADVAIGMIAIDRTLEAARDAMTALARA